MFDIDISELARRAGVTAATLRFYEEKGLIASTGRRGLKRMFDAGTPERLSLIALGRASGFALDEIAAMLGGPDIDRDRLRAKAAELDRRIETLGRMRDGLRHAADCAAPTLMECDHFRRIVRVVTKDAASPRARRRFRAEAL